MEFSTPFREKLKLKNKTVCLKVMIVPIIVSGNIDTVLGNCVWACDKKTLVDNCQCFTFLNRCYYGLYLNLNPKKFNNKE